MKKQVLHIGPAKSGTVPHGFPAHEWQEVRFDIDPYGKPDIVGDMRDMHMIASNSIDAIFSSHTIEHLYPADVKLAFEEALRVLRPDGFLLMSCPDLQSIGSLLAEGKLLEKLYESDEGTITPIDVIYGFRGYFTLPDRREAMTHRTGFTLPIMINSLQSIGFPSVTGKRRLSGYELWVYASKAPLPEPELARRAQQQIPQHD